MEQLSEVLESLQMMVSEVRDTIPRQPYFEFDNNGELVSPVTMGWAELIHIKHNPNVKEKLVTFLTRHGCNDEDMKLFEKNYYKGGRQYGYKF